MLPGIALKDVGRNKIWPSMGRCLACSMSLLLDWPGCTDSEKTLVIWCCFGWETTCHWIHRPPNRAESSCRPFTDFLLVKDFWNASFHRLLCEHEAFARWTLSSTHSNVASWKIYQITKSCGISLALKLLQVWKSCSIPQTLLSTLVSFSISASDRRIRFHDTRTDWIWVSSSQPFFQVRNRGSTLKASVSNLSRCKGSPAAFCHALTLVSENPHWFGH